MGNASFQQQSRSIVNDFLSTAVVYDDQLSFDEVRAPTHLKPPSRETKTTHVPRVKLSLSEITHSLNAKEIIDSFSNKGIICAAFRPNKEELIDNQLLSIISSDIVILDWYIHEKEGDAAIKIINEIIKDYELKGPGIRLIIIYTAEKTLPRIAAKIKKNISNSADFEQSDNGCVLKRDSLQISVYAKPGASVDSDLKKREVNVELLVEKIIDEFTDMTSGLLSNLVLKAISTIRNQTHHILHKFYPDLDAPYLSHRSLLPYPDDAINHAIELIGSELQSLLNNNELKRIVDIWSISSWLDSRNTQNFTLHFPSGKEKEITRDNLILSLTRGIENVKATINRNESDDDKKVTNNIFKTLTQSFCTDKGDAMELDYQYSLLTTLKSDIEIPILKTGSIIVLGDTSPKVITEMYLCIQPICNCYRNEGIVEFPFLKLLVQDIKNTKFDLIVKYKSCYFKLKKSYDISLIKFNISNQEGTVEFNPQPGHPKYTSTDDTECFWVSELKSFHIQRLIHEYASKISRIGLDEYEWLRRSSKQH